VSTAGDYTTRETTVPAIADRLNQYATAISDPTRGMIVLELDRAGELTATQLARRLGLTANNVYHHMRVLLQLGVVGQPRVVPGDSYVEKYYSIDPELQAALRLDQEWYQRVGPTLTPEDQRALTISLCLTMSELLRRAARNTRTPEQESLSAFLDDRRQHLLSMNRLSPAQMRDRLERMRLVLQDEDRAWAEETDARTDLFLMAGLPGMFVAEDAGE
jgi:DNA-binding transcriptional ArsR family regulator